MDTSISRISDFRAPPPYPQLAAFEEKPAPGLSGARLDELDAIATRLLSGKSCEEWYGLPVNESIYVALAVNHTGLLRRLDLTIAEAIDKLGWVDASAMVARWSKRKG